MRRRGVIGRRIVGVRQQTYYDGQTGRMRCTVDALVLDNGSELRTFAIELEGSVTGDLLYVPARRLRPAAVGAS